MPTVRTCVRIVVICTFIPRFELIVAAAGRAVLLREPVALAPLPGGERRVGEVSAAAEAFGIRAGMGLGEALARCPRLALLPPDPTEVADSWERALTALESIGAAVEPERPGLACFDARGLRGLYGGIEGVLAATRRALGAPVRIGVAPARFCAAAAAARARPRRAEVVHGGEAGARTYLAPLPVTLLRARGQTAGLTEALERLGVLTLGELARLPRAALADRFGRIGLLASDLAHGRDGPLVTRSPAERLEEALELPEAAFGGQLERALELLIGRLLARR